MVLIFDQKLQKDLPKTINTFYNSFPVYRESANIFLSNKNAEIGPKGLLYVGQREFAVTSPQDVNVNIIGSDDATTCIIAIIRHSVTAVTALSHFDGTDVEHVVGQMIERIQGLCGADLDGKLELQLIGGYSEEKHYSEQIFCNAINKFHSHPLEIYVTLVCVGDLNTIVRDGVAHPVVYGAGIVLQTGKVFPATFSYRGPDEELRHARLYSSGKFLEIYDSNKGLLKIGPFSYTFDYDIDFLLEQEDGVLLQYFSTSPLVEPPHYMQQLRNTWKFIKENPDPRKTIFKNGQPRCFKRNDDCSAWVPIQI